MPNTNIPRNRTGREVNKPLPSHAKEALPKPYLRAHNLKEGGHNVRIQRVAWVEKFDSHNKKWGEVMALFFYTKDGKPKYLALSSETLLSQTIEATGKPDPNDWGDQVICIFPTKVTAGGEVYDVIRVKKMDASLDPALTPVIEKSNPGGSR